MLVADNSQITQQTGFDAIRRNTHVRIGILGGTFDPVHFAHLAIAEQALQQLDLDRVLFVPAWIAPHKTEGQAGQPARARTEHRLAMLKLALDGNPAFEVCDNELARKGTSYTVDTIEELYEQFGLNAELFLLIGADNYAIFQSWREPDRIMQHCRVAVYNRPGSSVEHISPPFISLDGPQFDLASTWLREQIGAGKSVRYLVPEPVRHYIESQRLYTEERQP
jgi:nicotinate-nucleotide adenylyltransferase